jgi:hypothetical protein
MGLSICPDCSTARSVREMIVAEGFWENALVTSLPFVVLVVTSVLAYRGPSLRVRGEMERKPEANS